MISHSQTDRTAHPSLVLIDNPNNIEHDFRSNIEQGKKDIKISTQQTFPATSSNTHLKRQLLCDFSQPRASSKMRPAQTRAPSQRLLQTLPIHHPHPANCNIRSTASFRRHNFKLRVLESVDSSSQSAPSHKPTCKLSPMTLKHNHIRSPESTIFQSRTTRGTTHLTLKPKLATTADLKRKTGTEGARSC